MSVQRQMRRAAARKMGKKWEGPDTSFKALPDGGYEALHPRKGWRRFSAVRLRAQARLRTLIERLSARSA
jgi:hypothetical protein